MWSAWVGGASETSNTVNDVARPNRVTKRMIATSASAKK
jgi:hypothetical protein